MLLAAIAIVAVVVILIRTGAGAAPDASAEAVTHSVDEAQAARRLAESIRMRTISPGVVGFDPEHMLAFRDWLARSYPLLHSRATRTLVGEYSLLFELPGEDLSLKPALLAAHFDVVPVVPGTEGDWEQPPYSGAQVDGFVWGRGAIDDKGSLVAIMEAVESQLAAGYTPPRTLYFAFGHDEEIGGADGAMQMAAKLAADGVELAWVLDEGGVIGIDVLAGVSTPIATVGIAEKGSVSLEIVASAAGGHSSMPPRDSAIAVLAGAISTVNNAPVPAAVDGVTANFLDAIAPILPFSQRLAVRNRWLLEGVLIDQLSKAPAANAMLRTTTAPTMINAGVKENVLPSTARAVVNFRVHPRDTPDSIERYVSNRIASDRVSVAKLDEGREASVVSPVDGEAYALIEQTINRVFPEVVVAPYLVVGGTDARHYDSLTDNVYRFIPVPMDDSDRARFHGTNERIAVSDLVRAVIFYQDLLLNL